MIVQEMVGAMFDESKVPNTSLGEVVQTKINILNVSHIRVNKNKTPMNYDSKADERILLGYSSRSQYYKFYNKTLCRIVESIDMRINEASLHIGRQK